MISHCRAIIAFLRCDKISFGLILKDICVRNERYLVKVLTIKYSFIQFIHSAKTLTRLIYFWMKSNKVFIVAIAIKSISGTITSSLKVN